MCNHYKSSNLPCLPSYIYPLQEILPRLLRSLSSCWPCCNLEIFTRGSRCFCLPAMMKMRPCRCDHHHHHHPKALLWTFVVASSVSILSYTEHVAKETEILNLNIYNVTEAPLQIGDWRVHTRAYTHAPSAGGRKAMAGSAPPPLTLHTHARACTDTRIRSPPPPIN